MQARLALVLAASAALLLSACGKKTESGPGAGSAAPAAGGGDDKPVAKAAAATGDKKLAKVGITAQLPADAIIDEQKVDSGGMSATISYGEMPNFFISTVDETSDNYDRTLKTSEAKAFKVQEKAADNSTWKLAYTFADLIEPTKMSYGVAVRSKVGSKLYDCGSRGLSNEAQANELLKICTTLK